jgi:integrase
MAGKVLTARSVEAAQPKAKRVEYPDAGCPGLYLVVQPSGVKSWALRYRRPDGKSAKHTLGRAGEDGLTLAAARHAAAALRLELEQGADPAPKRAPKAAYHPTTGDAVEAMVASFLELHARRKNRASTAWASERIFNRLVLPTWRGRSVHEIRRRDVIALVEQVATDRPYLANRTLGALSKFFNWLVSRDVLAASPAIGVERPHKEQPRTRILAEDELRRLLLAAGSDNPFDRALWLLVLTGCRRNEVSQMRWSEIDADQRLRVIPSERAKNNRRHSVPLSTQAWRIIDAMPRFAECDYVFSVDGRGPIIGWAKAKTRLSGKAGLAEENWRLHDLRRGSAAGMQRLGIRTEVIERALNHVSGVFRGIVGVYQVDRLDDEVRVALQAWGDQVERVVTGTPTQVVSIRAGRR